MHKNTWRKLFQPRLTTALRYVEINFLAVSFEVILKTNKSEPVGLDSSLLSDYRPQTKFAKVMFSQVSVCQQGVSAPLHAGYTPLLDRHPQADTPWADTPPGRHTPPGQTSPGQTPPWVGGTHPIGMHSCFICKFRYSDFWLGEIKFIANHSCFNRSYFVVVVKVTRFIMTNLIQSALPAFMGSYASRHETSWLTHHFTLFSLKPQQFMRQWRPFTNDNEANYQKS